MFRTWPSKIFLALAFLASTLVSGCASIRSEMFSTDACSDQKQAKRLAGVPTTIDVPTHVKLVILEKKYFKKEDKTWTRLDIPAARDVEFDLVTMKELYTVDLKRPASGTINYDLTFLEDENKKPLQRLKTLKTKTVDTTIQDTAVLIQAIIASTPTLASLGKIKLATETADSDKREQKVDKNGVFEMSGVVACDLFELRDPQISHRMREFLERYMNDCHACPLPRTTLTHDAPGRCR